MVALANSLRPLLPLYGAAALLALGVPAHASFSLFSDFDNGYTLGALNGQNGWVVQGGSAVPSIVIDPADPLNHVASFASAGNISRPLPLSIDNSSTGTLFFRMNAPGGGVNFNIGVTDLSSGSFADSFENFRSQLRLGNSATKATEIDVRLGGAFTTGTANTSVFVPNTWFNVWLVINNATDTTQFYVSTGDSNAPATPFAQGSFRAGTNNPIATFYARTSGTAATLVDDIYYDATGSNLTNPVTIPEPATAGLVLLGLAGLMGRRRTFRR